MHFQFLANCTCKDLVNENGGGKCTKESWRSHNKVYCYVNQPTSCNDALDSINLPGEKYSAQACKIRKFTFHPTKHLLEL